MSRKEHEDKNIYLEAHSVEVGGLGVGGVGGHEPVPHVAVGRLPVHVVGAAEHAEGLHQSEVSITGALTNQRPELRHTSARVNSSSLARRWRLTANSRSLTVWDTRLPAAELDTSRPDT